MGATLSARGGMIFRTDGVLVGFMDLRSGTDYLRNNIHPGCRVQLVEFAPSVVLPNGEPGFAVGDTGTVVDVDDFGTVYVRWDNGRFLGLCPDDSYDVLDEYVIEEEEGTRV